MADVRSVPEAEDELGVLQAAPDRGGEPGPDLLHLDRLVQI